MKILKDELKDELSLLVSGGTFIVATNWCSLFNVVCSRTIRILSLVNVLFLNVTFILISLGFFYPVSCLLLITVFEFGITFWIWLVNGFQKVRVETSLFPDYILDDTLDNDTPNGDTGINSNNENNDRNHHNNHNDDDIDHN